MVPHDPSEDDIDLFRRSVGVVHRLKDDKVRPIKERPRPIPRRPLDNENPLQDGDMLSDGPYERDLGPGEELIFCRPGVAKRTIKKLRRGQFSAQAELDLHGLTVNEAQDSLAVFLEECQNRQYRAVRIVHGKGYGSQGGRPIIKAKLERWLRLRSEVIAFSSARPADGGTGAVYVLLRS